MTEHELLELIINDNRKEKEELLLSLRIKTAGVADLVAKHPGVLGSIIGAAVFTGAQYMANRPGKKGISAQQSASRVALKSYEAADKERQEQGKSPSFTHDAIGSAVRGAKDLSDVMTKYPLRSALTYAAGPGAMLGYNITKRLITAGKG